MRIATSGAWRVGEAENGAGWWPLASAAGTAATL
jgi:hypothetical protein